MFVAAIVDAWPSLATDVDDALACVELPGTLTADVVDYDDGTTIGRRFQVRCPEEGHPHRRYRVIRSMLDGSALDERIRKRAIDVFSHLAEAEARVHGVASDDVEFHEVGAWDSIADIVAAAAVIERCGASSWSVGALPLGSGLVDTAHGKLPVPAPATALLLEGFTVIDDGLPGERVTPTGAAILRSLEPSVVRPATPHHVGPVGTGFGFRRLEDRPNALRVMALTPAPAPVTDVVGVVEFDVDDQTAEDLAVGLDRLRSARGVLDVIQRVGYGKKGRLVTEVRVLCDADVIDSVVEGCLSETTTLGVRWSTRNRTILERRSDSTSAGTRVKTARRPDGRTSAKTEMDDLADVGDRLARDDQRRRAEDDVRRSGR